METYSCRNQAMEDSQTPAAASSVKALRHHGREVLEKLIMQKTFSKESESDSSKGGGIALASKHWRLQLASAAIVAKLVRFASQGIALKEMFGLSFTPSITKRRSYIV